MSSKVPTDAFVDLDLRTCARIQEFYDHLEEKNLFEVLDVDPDASLIDLRRAYFKRSKQFHPDRFFSRKLGPYKKMLERIFQWCHAAFKFLKDEKQRELYKKRILRLSEPRGRKRPPSVRIVPVERHGALEFVISEEEEQPRQSPAPRPPPRAARSPKAQILEGDTFEFFVDEVPNEPNPRKPVDTDEGLEFVIDD
jgi:curved DNA-binding protein CbpA